jgi:thiamine biosynthesis lipoprotein
MQRLQFDDAAGTLKFETGGMVLDLGGFGKGFALEGMAEHFRQRGVQRAFISFGESSVTVLGSHPHGPAWPVGIANMFHSETAVHTFNLRDASLSTSGTAPFNETGGAKNFGHIINPHDGRPIEGYRTMSIAAPNAADAEVLSTALLVMSETERAEILSGYPGVSGIEIVYEPHNNFAPRIQWRYET